MGRTYLMIILLLYAIAAFSQTEYRLSVKDSKMIIRGTSSLHNWQCKAEQISGQMNVQVDGDKLVNVQSLSVNIQSISIKSIQENGAYFDKNMDKNVYKALQADRHPAILFNLTNLTLSNTTANVTGLLKIAGKSNEIKFNARHSKIAGGMVFEGKVPLKMTDYNVDPPTALFGTIRTGNEITVEFKMVFIPAK
jgi:polyisoprenoid-binding protein YceI